MHFSLKIFLKWCVFKPLFWITLKRHWLVGKGPRSEVWLENIVQTFSVLPDQRSHPLQENNHTQVSQSSVTKSYYLTSLSFLSWTQTAWRISHFWKISTQKSKGFGIHWWSILMYLRNKVFVYPMFYIPRIKQYEVYIKKTLLLKK